jgi:hypothetical protein
MTDNESKLGRPPERKSKGKTQKSVASKKDLDSRGPRGLKSGGTKNKPKSNGKHPGGRPPKLSDDEKGLLLKKFEIYINETDIPIIKEFAYKNEVISTNLYDWVEFSTLLKRCTDKKEAALERKALKGEINTGMAAFSLKQLGWSDQQRAHVEITQKPAIDYSKLSTDELKKLESLLKKAKPDGSI